MIQSIPSPDAVRPHPPTLVSEAPVDFSRLLYLLYLDIEQQITRADTKSQLILSIDTVLLAVISSSILGLPTGSESETNLPIMILILSDLFILAMLIVSIMFAMQATFPRFSRTQPAGRKSFYFVGHIIAQSAEAYADAFMDLPLEQVKRDIMIQIHAKASVVTYKFSRVRRSMLFALVGISAWGVLRVLLSIL